MKSIINDKEIIFFLTSCIDYSRYVEQWGFEAIETDRAIAWANERKDNLKKFKVKIKEKIDAAVRRDLEKSLKDFNKFIQEKKNKNFILIKNNLEKIIDIVGIDNILNEYQKSRYTGFCKNIALQIDSNVTFVRRKDYIDSKEVSIFRNTVGGKNFITQKIDNRANFWFIDSGYTNFLSKQKNWHRLVKDHLHFNKIFEAPVDRLGMFEHFPQQWRTGGDKILVIEPGPFAASIFHVEVIQWKSWVEQELRKYTDKKIIFREKVEKKKRLPLYKHLCNEDYACVISINSNAATEAIWAGVPVITLDKHITNSVSRKNLSEINNLYTGSLANWLAMLSYSQFTYDELMDGTAVEIVRKYHV